MKITPTLLCIGLAPIAVAGAGEDENCINAGYLYVDSDPTSQDQVVNVSSCEIMEGSSASSFAEMSITTTQTADPMVSISSYTSVGSVNLFSSNPDYRVDGAGQRLDVEHVVNAGARLIAANGGCINLIDATLNLTSHSEDLYSYGVANGIFTLDLSKTFTSDGALAGGFYEGDLTINITDKGMRELIKKLQDEELGLNIVIGNDQSMDLDSLTLASRNVAITFDTVGHIGTGVSGCLIPEPSTASLSLLALASLLARRRRARPSL